MIKMDLTLTFAFSEASVKKPRGVDEKGLLTKATGIKMGGWVDVVVRIGFEAYHWRKKWGVDV